MCAEYVCILSTVLLKGKYQKKMFPKICQWIPSPKYILTLISYDPKSESGVLLKYFSVKEKICLKFTFLHFETQKGKQT